MVGCVLVGGGSDSSSDTGNATAKGCVEGCSGNERILAPRANSDRNKGVWV